MWKQVEIFQVRIFQELNNPVFSAEGNNRYLRLFPYFRDIIFVLIIERGALSIPKISSHDAFLSRWPFKNANGPAVSSGNLGGSGRVDRRREGRVFFPFVAYMSGEIDYGHALNNAVINSGGVLPHLFRERGR